MHLGLRLPFDHTVQSIASHTSVCHLSGYGVTSTLTGCLLITPFGLSFEWLRGDQHFDRLRQSDVFLELEELSPFPTSLHHQTELHVTGL